MSKPVGPASAREGQRTLDAGRGTTSAAGRAPDLARNRDRPRGRRRHPSAHRCPDRAGLVDPRTGRRRAPRGRRTCPAPAGSTSGRAGASSAQGACRLRVSPSLRRSVPACRGLQQRPIRRGKSTRAGSQLPRRFRPLGAPRLRPRVSAGAIDDCSRSLLEAPTATQLGIVRDLFCDAALALEQHP